MPDVDRPLVGRGDVTDAGGRPASRPAPPTAAGSRSAGWSRRAGPGRAVRLDVRVAGAGRGVGDDEPPQPLHHLVVGPVRGAAGAPVDRVHQLDVARRCPPGPSRSPGSPTGRRCPTAPSAGAARSRPAGSAGPPSGRPTTRASRAGSPGRGGGRRRGGPCRCPVPGPAAGRRRSRGSTSARGCTTSRSRPARRRPRRPSSRRGRCSRKCRCAPSRPRPRSGERSSGSGQDAAGHPDVQLVEALGAEPLGGRRRRPPSSAGWSGRVTRTT